MAHSIGWVDDEVCGVTWCNGERLDVALAINIYDWAECPKCGKKLKLQQSNEILEK